MIEYQRIFLEKIKTLLPYFVKFKKDGTILPKKYSEDCIVGGLDWQSIIMVIYNKSIFSANDCY